MEKYREGQRQLQRIFIDLERVPQGEVLKCPKEKEVHPADKGSVRGQPDPGECTARTIDASAVTVGVHRGSTLKTA